MPKVRKPQDIVDTENYRVDNFVLSGKALKYLIIRSKKNRRSLSEYSSFLVENLILDYAERMPNDLINSKWSEQVEINDNTLKREK